MHRIKKRYVFLFSAPLVSAWGLAFAVLACFPPGWNGGFHLWRYSGGVSRSTALTGGFSPIQVPWVPVYLVSCSWSCCLRHVQVVCSYRCPSCLSHPSPAWFSSKTSASRVSTVASAPDSERAFSFGSFSLLDVQLGLVSYPSG